MKPNIRRFFFPLPPSEWEKEARKTIARYRLFTVHITLTYLNTHVQWKWYTYRIPMAIQGASSNAKYLCFPVRYAIRLHREFFLLFFFAFHYRKYFATKHKNLETTKSIFYSISILWNFVLVRFCETLCRTVCHRLHVYNSFFFLILFSVCDAHPTPFNLLFRARIIE